MKDLKNLEGECRKFLNFCRSIILVKRFLFFFLKEKVQSFLRNGETAIQFYD